MQILPIEAGTIKKTYQAVHQVTGEVRLWDLEQSPPSFTALNVPEGTNPWTTLFSPDGATVAAGGGGGVFTWPLGDVEAEPDTLISVQPGWQAARQWRSRS